jgi:hypothetical protein
MPVRSRQTRNITIKIFIGFNSMGAILSFSKKDRAWLRLHRKTGLRYVSCD